MANLVALLGPVILLTTMIGIALRSSGALLEHIAQEQIWHKNRNVGINDLIIGAVQDPQGKAEGLYCVDGRMGIALSLCLLPTRREVAGSEELSKLFDQEARVSVCPIAEIPSDGSSRLSPRGQKLTRGSNIAARTCESASFGSLMGANVSSAVIAEDRAIFAEKVLATTGFMEADLLIAVDRIALVAGGDLRIGTIAGTDKAVVTLLSATGRVEVGSVLGGSQVHAISYKKPVIASDVLALGIVQVEDLIRRFEFSPIPAGILVRHRGDAH